MRGGFAAALILGLIACIPNPIPVSGTDDATHVPEGTATGGGGGNAEPAPNAGAAPDDGAVDASPVADAAGGAAPDPSSPAPDGSLEAGGSDAHDDSSPDTGSVLCAGLLCEDFEKGQIDPAIWDVKMGGGGTLNVQQQTVAHGKYAMQVHAQVGPTQDFAFIVTRSAPSALRGTAVYGRAYFLITPDPLTSTHTEMIFAGTNGTGPNNGAAPFPKLRYMEVANLYGAWQLALDLLDQSPPVEIVAYPNKNVPTMTWTCMEWHFEDQPDRITLWTNGNLIGTFDDQHIGFTANPVPLPLPGAPIYKGTSSGIVGGFDQFGFGFHDFGPKKPFDLYYDDVVLDTKRVGCLP